jgi:hypothetical protein
MARSLYCVSRRWEIRLDQPSLRRLFRFDEAIAPASMIEDTVSLDRDRDRQRTPLRQISDGPASFPLSFQNAKPFCPAGRSTPLLSPSTCGTAGERGGKIRRRACRHAARWCATRLHPSGCDGIAAPEGRGGSCWGRDGQSPLSPAEGTWGRTGLIAARANPRAIGKVQPANRRRLC